MCAHEVTRGDGFIGGKTPKENTRLAEKEEMTAYAGGHLCVLQPWLRSQLQSTRWGKTVGLTSSYSPVHNDCKHLVILTYSKSRERIIEFPHELQFFTGVQALQEPVSTATLERGLKNRK